MVMLVVCIIISRVLSPLICLVKFLVILSTDSRHPSVSSSVIMNLNLFV